MNVTKTLPQSGQFVATWEYMGSVWSETFKWINGELMEYSRQDGYFVPQNSDEDEDDLPTTFEERMAICENLQFIVNL